MRDLALHMREEEKTQLPALEQEAIEGGSERLSTLFSLMKVLVPTRAYVIGRQWRPLEVFFYGGAVMIDFLGDRFRRFPRK